MFATLFSFAFVLTSCSLLQKEEVEFESEQTSKESEQTNQTANEKEQTKETSQEETSEQAKEVAQSTTEESTVLYVYICGQVQQPGVYSLQSGQRVNDVVNMAGGFTKEAHEESLNLARKVVDGEQIYVMSKEEAATSTALREMLTQSASEEETADSSQEAASQKVNINTASKEQLMTLSGIGESKAESILAYRQENGPFQSIEEIKQITGIKDGVFNKIKDQITTD